MSDPIPQRPSTPAPRLGTSWVDRVNIAIHFRRYFKLVARRWLIMLVCATVGASYSAYKAYKTPYMYRAISVIGFALKVQTANNNKVQVLEAMDKYHETQLQFMQSSVVLSKVEEKMNAGGAPLGPTPLHYASPSPGKGSTFLLMVDSTDFYYASRYASNWAHAFIDFKKSQFETSLGHSAVATEEERNTYEKKLAKARSDLERFQIEHNIGSVKDTLTGAEQRLEKLLDESYGLSTQRERLENNTREDIANGALMERPKKASDVTGPTPAATASQDTTDPMAKFAGQSKYRDLKLQIRKDESDLQSHAATLRPGHPFMVNLRHEVDQLKQELNFQLDLIEEERLAHIKSLKEQEAAIKPEIERMRGQVLQLGKIQNDYDRLIDEEKNVRTILDGLRKSLQSFDLATGDEGQFSIIEEGVGSPMTITPQRSRRILNGLLAGLGAGLAIVYFLNRLDDRLELAEDVEAALDQPVLGQIPQVDTKTLAGGPLLVTRMHQHDMFVEAIRGVRSAIMLGTEPGSRQVILVSSAVPGDGKTTFTVNFAVTLALANHRVLLVEADLRRGNVHGFFGQPREPGLTDVLTGQIHWQDVTRETELDALRVITSGALPPNPGELLGGPIMREFVSEARTEYDYIVFDCPPLTAIDDTFCLAGLSDGILFVVRAGQTSIRFAKNALDAVRHRGARILGIVLNGITPDNPYYYYNYYYHSYYNEKDDSKPVLPPNRHQPASKMASRKNPTRKAVSIEASAKAKAGQPVSTSIMLSESHAKAQEYRARRGSPETPSLHQADPARVKPEPPAGPLMPS